VVGMYRHAENRGQIKKYKLNPEILNIWCHLEARCIGMGSKGNVFALHATEVYGGEGLQDHSFLTSVLDEGKWSASQLGHFTTEESPRYPLHMIGNVHQSKYCSFRGKNQTRILSRPALVLVFINTALL
jgi:hypothetical protein